MHEHQAHGHDQQNKFMVGLDVGSTTVKAVVVNAATDEILWQDYQRHETKQPEKTLEFLKRMEKDAGISRHNTRMFLTGSGGGGIAEQIGAKFVQEVTAVSLAVEKLHPEVYSVVELGGQDAKIIVFKDDDESGRKKKIPSMNDKCAGGTGAVIDKINAKLKIPVEELAEQGYHGIKLHKVAGKCGVFAETDTKDTRSLSITLSSGGRRRRRSPAARDWSRLRRNWRSSKISIAARNSCRRPFRRIQLSLALWGLMAVQRQPKQSY